MTRLLLALALAAAPALATAAPLTVRTGETWLFRIDRGQPANARKVAPATAPTRGDVKVSVRAAFGTMMTISINSTQGYTFDAQLIDAMGKATSARSCTLRRTTNRRWKTGRKNPRPCASAILNLQRAGTADP